MQIFAEMMKHFFIPLLFWIGVSLNACSEDYVADVNPIEYSSMQETLRGIKPKTTQGRQGAIENYGEKGRDRRDLYEGERYKLNPEGTVIEDFASFHETQHDRNGECIFNIYWAYSSDYLKFIPFLGYELHMTFLNEDEEIYQMVTPPYYLDDTFTIPKEVCENTTTINFSYYQYDNYREDRTFTYHKLNK